MFWPWTRADAAVRRTSSFIALVVAGLAAAIAAGWAVHWSVQRTQQEARRAAGPRDMLQRTPQAKIVRPRLEAFDEKGKATWALRLDEAELGRGGSQVSGAGLREGVIYDPKTGKGVVRVVGDTVSYNLATRNFELSGNVRVVHSNGQLLTMARAAYIEAEKKLMCTGRVVGRDKDIVVSTETALYWPHENVVQCPGPVTWRTKGGTEFSGRDLRMDFDAKRLTMAKPQGLINLEEARSGVARRQAG